MVCYYCLSLGCKIMLLDRFKRTVLRGREIAQCLLVLVLVDSHWLHLDSEWLLVSHVSARTLRKSCLSVSTKYFVVSDILCGCD